MKTSITLSTIVLSLLFASTAQAQKVTSTKPSRYAIVEIATQDTTVRTSASAVNDRGEVSGNFARPDRTDAFVRDSSSTYKTVTSNSGTNMNARNISPWGTVVGDIVSDVSRRAFRWDAATGMDTLATGDTSLAYGINGAGETVGEFTSNGQRRAFFWDRFGNVTEVSSGGIVTILTSTVAYGINNDQQVAGFTIASDGFSHAFLWAPGVGMKQFFSGPQNSTAYAINDAGQMAGMLQTSQGTKAFVLDTISGAYTVYPTLSPKAVSIASAINGNGVAVGQSANRAALFMAGKTYDLNSLVSLPTGMVLTNATSINGNGQIVVSGTQNGVTHSFLLTPLS